MIIIGGVTGSGKSSLAIELAKKIDGEIVSADSMQIYKYMDVGTAKIKKIEMQGVPHYMLDVVEPTDSFSVAEYVERAEIAIKGIEERRKTPIIVGGTGLYINGLIYPFSFGNAQGNPLLRQKLEKEWESLGGESLYARLIEYDKVAAEQIHPNNKKRIIRAIEIIESGGSLSKQAEKIPKRSFKMFAIEKDRREYYDNIDARVEKMFAEGLEDEVKSLIDNRGVDFKMQSMQAIGYKEFEKYLKKEINREELIALIKKNSRNYAKRQTTWFKRYTELNWLKSSNLEDNIDTIIKIITK